jgi:hypothetical protein
MLIGSQRRRLPSSSIASLRATVISQARTVCPGGLTAQELQPRELAGVLDRAAVGVDQPAHDAAELVGEGQEQRGLVALEGLARARRAHRVSGPA